MIVPAQDQTDYLNSLQSLYDELNDAYWNASSVQAKDSLVGISQNLYSIITALNQGALDTATAQYVSLKATVANINTKLANAQAQINNWVHVLSIATQIVNAITQVLAEAAKVFAA